LIPQANAEKQRRDFFECIATIMTTQMQQLCISSINDFTEFLCDTKVMANIKNFRQKSYFFLYANFIVKAK
jgi:hypothetical protein